MFYKLLNAYTRRFPFPRRGLKYFLKTAKWLGIDNKTYSKKLANNLYMRVSPSEHIQQQLFWYGHYEKELGDLIRKLLKPGDVFLDIGANIGYFSLLAAKHEPTANIVSFEPVSSVFKKLEENISLNMTKNVNALNLAVGERNEEREIYISDQDNTGMSSFKKPENYSGRTERVKVITIDEWFRSSAMPTIDLIKLDVEGSELVAIKGMRETLNICKPLLAVEINPETLSQFHLMPEDIFQYLGELRFRSFLILSGGALKQINSYQSYETGNVLFIHDEKVRLYNHLICN